MRIIVVSDTGEVVGGAPKVAIDSAVALADAGLDIVFVSAVEGVPDPRLDHPRIERVGLGQRDVWELPRAAGAAAAIWNRGAARRLEAVLRERARPGTVLHVHGWTRALSPAGFAAARRVGLPVVVTAHQHFLACPTGGFYRADRNGPCALSPLSPRCLAAPCDPGGRAVKAVRVARGFALRAALAGLPLDVIHVSDLTRARLAPHLPRGTRHHRVNNPVLARRGPPAPIGEGSRALILGRLVPEKGVAEAVTAVRRAGLRSLVVGAGPEEAAVRAADPEAELRAWIAPEGVGDLLRREARVLVAPSRWPEPGPLTIYEAVAAGVPVVASDLCGAAERLTPGEDGIVTSPEVEPLARALATFADLGAARRMGASAYLRYWSAPPTPEAHVARLLDVYAAALARAPRTMGGAAGAAAEVPHECSGAELAGRARG